MSSFSFMIGLIIDRKRGKRRSKRVEVKRNLVKAVVMNLFMIQRRIRNRKQRPILKIQLNQIQKRIQKRIPKRILKSIKKVKKLCIRNGI